MANSDEITILMGVFNGADHLTEQLGSIVSQSGVQWYLIASDDGSTDGSAMCLARFQDMFPDRCSTRIGPRKGFAANFLQLMRALDAKPGWIALADQDDIWFPGKLARAQTMLRKFGSQPALYCGRRYIWVPQEHRITPTSGPSQDLGFCNALIENIAFGNTIVLNPAAAALAREAASLTERVFAHDWWLYLLMTGLGARVIFDPGPPQILYRQHRHNAIGAGQGMKAWMCRKRQVLRGDFADRVQQNLSAMDRVRHMLTPQSATLLSRFSGAREATFWPRVKRLRAIGPYRQSRLATMAFWGAAGLGHL